MAVLEDGICAHCGEVDIGSVISETLKLLDHFLGVIVCASCVNDYTEWFGGQGSLSSKFSSLLQAVDF